MTFRRPRVNSFARISQSIKNWQTSSSGDVSFVSMKSVNSTMRSKAVCSVDDTGFSLNAKNPDGSKRRQMTRQDQVPASSGRRGLIRTRETSLNTYFRGKQGSFWWKGEKVIDWTKPIEWIEDGDTYPARVICTDAIGKAFPVVCLVTIGGEERIRWCETDGSRRGYGHAQNVGGVP